MSPTSYQAAPPRDVRQYLQPRPIWVKRLSLPTRKIAIYDAAPMHRVASGVLVFFTSAVVLLLEILAGRLLAPYLGVTLETYSGIIGVVLAGLALGTWLGGRLADRGDPKTTLGPLLLLGGALTLAAIPIIRLLGAFDLGHGPFAIVLFASAAFFAPAAVLSAIPPAIVKLSLTDLAHTGRTVGRLSALSTAGALAGTFLTGFVLVSTLPTRPIVLTAGSLLVAAGLLLSRKNRTFPLIPVTVALCGAGFTWLIPGPCGFESAYFCATVESSPTRPQVKTLVLDGLRHASLDIDNPSHLELDYARSVAAVLSTLHPGAPLTSLFLGGGGFHLPRYLMVTRPGSSARVLELDPALLTIAQEQLGLPTPAPISVGLGDARVLLKSEPLAHYDFVLGDAFGSQAVPWHLTTREFLTSVHAAIKPGGLYVANLIDAPPLSFARAELRTLREVFRHVAVVAPLHPKYAINVILVASDEELDAGAITDALRAQTSTASVLSTTRSLDAFVADAPLLTDDFAPVDQLLTVN
jgi:spermidine synthase